MHLNNTSSVRAADGEMSVPSAAFCNSLIFFILPLPDIFPVFCGIDYMEQCGKDKEASSDQEGKTAFFRSGE